MIALILALLSPLAAAETLDLDSGTRLAAERALDADAAALSVRRQEIVARAADLSWTPDLTFRTSGQGSLGRTFSEQLGTNITEPVTSLSASLSASMPLYEGGSLRAQRERAAASLAVAEADQEQTRHTLRWLVADGLLQIEQAQATVAVQVAALTAEQALLGQVTVQVEAGTRTPADRHAQQAAVATRQASLASAEQALAEAELSLLNLLRLQPEQDWTFAPPPDLGEPGAPADLIAEAAAQRPDLRAAEESIRAAEAAQKIAQSAYRPSVSLGAGTSTAWLSSNPATFYGQLDDQSRTWASIDLSLPLLDRGVRRADVDTAEVDLLEARLSQQRLLDEVRLDVRTLQSAERAAQASLAASITAAASAQQAAEVLVLRYQTGAEALVSVTEARAAQVDAALQQAWSASALQRIRYQLAWTTGALSTP